MKVNTTEKFLRQSDTNYFAEFASQHWCKILFTIMWYCEIDFISIIEIFASIPISIFRKVQNYIAGFKSSFRENFENQIINLKSTECHKTLRTRVVHEIALYVICFTGN